MCDKHTPIIIYDCGGVQKYCEKCGIPLSKWEQNGQPKKHPPKDKKKVGK